MSLYVGVNNTPKKVKQLLVGVNSTPKEVKTGYAGGTNSTVNKVYEGFNLDDELSKVDPVKALTSGKITANDIGKTVYLSNSYATCQEWIIADVNHDGTSGTVDLFSKYILLNKDYPLCNTTAMNGFDVLRFTENAFTSDIKNNIKKPSYGYINNGRTNLKVPSLTEIGIRHSLQDTASINEGNLYPLFGSTINNSENSLARYSRPNGNLWPYWTRTQRGSYYNVIFYIAATGMAYDGTDSSDEFGIVAVIRF